MTERRLSRLGRLLRRRTLDELQPSGEVRKKLKIAERLPVVLNNFLTPEQAAYCMAWKDTVNHDSGPQTVIYTAMGPDISTVLLSTDATTVYGIDERHHSIYETNIYLHAWDYVDNALSLPPRNVGSLRKLYPENPEPDLSNETLSDLLGLTLGHKKARGYWHSNELSAWSLERCLVIELKKMGINPDDIQISDMGGHLRLDFPWAYPGDTPKQRTVIYHGIYISDIGKIPDLPVDGYYEKAVNTVTRDINTPINDNDLRQIASVIKPGGFVLIGRGGKEEQGESALERANRRALGDSFLPLGISEEYVRLMRQRLQHNQRYGLELYGAKKTTLTS